MTNLEELKYQDVISSDEFEEILDELGDGEIEEEDAEVKEEIQRLFNDYGPDFALIRYDYIEEYEEELIRECYIIPESLDWLFYHIDWKSVVSELCMSGDLSDDEFCGIQYYVERR